MAVHTQISKTDVDNFFKNYPIDEIIEFSGIKEGIENSNYLIKTEKNNFILTIFEKRTNEVDLPFFFRLMNHLKNHGIKCPEVVMDLKGNYYNSIHNKPAAVTTFLEGRSIIRIEPFHCGELGKAIALFHNASSLLDIKRENKLNTKNLHKLIQIIDSISDKVDQDELSFIKDEYKFLNENIPLELPQGIIHADLFPDNIFFHNNILSGIIDFYFSCNDSYIYEIAICMNAWCFEQNSNEFNISKAKALLSNYNQIRPLSKNEIEYMPILARVAALRFLLTRTIDFYKDTNNLLVTKKDPKEYFEKLKFHQSVLKSSEYGL